MFTSNSFNPPQTTLQLCTISTPSFQMRRLRHDEVCDLSKVTQWMFSRVRFQTQGIWLRKSCSLPLGHQPLVASHRLLVTSSGPLSRISGPSRHESLDSSPLYQGTPWYRTVFSYFASHKIMERDGFKSTPLGPAFRDSDSAGLGCSP